MKRVRSTKGWGNGSHQERSNYGLFRDAAPSNLRPPIDLVQHHCPLSGVRQQGAPDEFPGHIAKHNLERATEALTLKSVPLDAGRAKLLFFAHVGIP